MRHSPSSLKQFDSCPHRFFRQRILQDVQDMDSSAAAHGRKVHKELEDAVNDLTTGPWPQEHKAVETWLMEQLPEYPSVATERQLALDQDLQPCAFDDSTCWIRGIADLLLWSPQAGQMRVVDYKTGTKRESGVVLQMKFYALAAFAHSPLVKRVVTDVFWLKTGEHTIRQYDRSKLDDLKAYITTAIGRVESAVEFPKRRSGLCNGWCPVGDCEHWRPPQDDFSIPVLSFR